VPVNRICEFVVGLNRLYETLHRQAQKQFSQAIGKWRTMTNSSLLMFHGSEEDATDAEPSLHAQLVEMVAKRPGMSVADRSFNNTFIEADQVWSWV
jgi:hypothetical protein